MLSRVSPGQEVTAGDDILNQAGVSEGLAGQESSGMTSLPTGGLRQDLVLPVFAAEEKLPIGVLILSFPYDENFAARMSSKVEHDVAVAYDGRIVASTLTDSEGRPWANQIAPAQLRRAEFDNSSSYLFLETDDSRYFFRFVRLPAPGSTQPLLYGVGMPSSFIENAQRNLFRTVGLGLLAIGFGIAFLGLLSVRLIVRPVQKLLAATRTMASGNLSTTVALPRRDELGELAQNLDVVRLNSNRSLQAALLERDRNAAIVQSMGVAAVVTDHNSRMLAVNPAAEMLLARSQSHLIGQSLYDFFIVTARNDHVMVPMWEAGSVGVGGDHSPVVRGRFLLRERPQTTVDVISTRVQVEGEPGGYVHLLQDVTPQEQISLAKDEFILNAAHELRAPLSSLRTSIELLLEDYGTMSKGNLGLMLRHLQKSSLRFQSLVENLIEIDSIKAGRFRVHPVPTALDEIILDAVGQTAPLLQTRGQMIEVKQEGATGLRVMADRRRILQVIINLLNNASKYGPEDEPIMLSTCHGGGLAFVGVTDRGAGSRPRSKTISSSGFIARSRSRIRAAESDWDWHSQEKSSRHTVAPFA